MRMLRECALVLMSLAGCSSNDDACAEVRGDRCIRDGVQGLTCRVEACTVESMTGQEATSSDRLFPKTTIHIRPKLRIDIDQVNVDVPGSLRSKVAERGSLDVRVNGVPATRLEADANFPARVRFSFLRVRKEENVDVQISSTLTESMEISVALVNSTVTCQLCSL